MKLVISKTLVQSVLSVTGSVVGSFAVYQREVDEELLDMHGDKKDFKKESKEKTSPFSFVPHFNDIKEKTSKIFNLTKTPDEVVIEIPDAFIEDVVEFSAKMVRKTLPLALQQVKVAKDLATDAEHFFKKWQDKKSEDASATEDTPKE